MSELKILLSIEEVNTVLSALSERPFKLVADTIYKIRTQAEKQLQADKPGEKLPVEAAVTGGDNASN